MTKAQFLNMLDNNDVEGIVKTYLVEMNPTKLEETVDKIIAMLNKNHNNMSMVAHVAVNHFCIKVQLAFLKDKNGVTIKRW